MQEKRKPRFTGEQLYHIFIYVVLAVLAICILVPVAWVFMASIKQNAEFYGSPWALPLGVYWQNFVDAWTTARMGEFMLNSVLTTAIALALLLVVAQPFPLSGRQAAQHPVHGRIVHQRQLHRRAHLSDVRGCGQGAAGHRNRRIFPQ